MSRCDRHAIVGDFVFDGAVTHRNGDVVIEKVSNRCAHGAQPSGRCHVANRVSVAGFWDSRRLKLRESLARQVCDVKRLALVQQAAIGYCLSFDLSSFDQNGLASPEVNVGGRQVADALMISQIIVIGDEGLDLGFEIDRQVVILQKDAVLERLMPTLILPWVI
jgi:hypothetical protein